MVLWVVVVPIDELPEISLLTEFSCAFSYFSSLCLPASPLTLILLPAKPALASAVTEAFQPLSSDYDSFCALDLEVVLLSVLVIPT